MRYAIEGSVQTSGDRLRVNAQLIDAENDAHLWADRFEENRSDLLQMHDAIVHRIAFTIGIQLTDERARQAQTRAANPNAEDLAWRCSSGLMQTLWTAERDSAFRLCERALEIDPASFESLGASLQMILSLREANGYALAEPVAALHARERAKRVGVGVVRRRDERFRIRGRGSLH